MARSERWSVDRRWVERGVHGLVSRNRFTIAVVFPAVGAVGLLASARGLLPPTLAFNPALVLFGATVMRLPLVGGLLPITHRRAALAVGALVAYAYGIELLGVTTGWPYGSFEYLVALGPMVAGVPVGLPVFFVPLVVNSYLLVGVLLGEAGSRPAVRVGATALSVLAMDVVLDPGAVALGFWRYEGGGVFYGVPLSNYAGWILSAVVAVMALDWGYESTRIGERLTDCPYLLDDLVSFVLLWGVVNAVYGQWIPATVAAAFGIALVATDRFDFAVVGRNLPRVSFR
ncbi:MAG: bisanhydrobacterioruberin hydratase [Halanaeroarchaeum sp.]